VQTDWQAHWDEMKSKFETANPNITLNSVGVGESNDSFITKRQASGDMPDVMQVNNNDVFRAIVDKGLLKDVSDTDGAKHTPKSYLDAYTYNGTCFGVSQGVAFTLLYCNMDLLGKAGWDKAPTNWDEFIKCCDDIKTKTPDIAPLCVAAGKTTSCWFIPELLIANVMGETLGQGKYEEEAKAGTFDYSANAEIAKRLDQIQPYLMTGVSGMSEDDITSTMTDGTCAMALAGNWTANNILNGITTVAGSADKAVCVLAPFNDAGKEPWISNSPEDGFGLSNQKDDDDTVKARETFYNWVFQPENFAIIQNARGTVPLLDNMTSDQIKLPAAVSAVVSNVQSAKYVTMSFNLYTSTFYDSSCVTLRNLYGGTAKGADVCKSLTDGLKTDHVTK